MPDWLAATLPLLAALAVLAELALLIFTERRRGWPWWAFTLPSRLLLLGVLLHLAFGLGRPVSTAGALTVLAIGARAVADVLAILGRQVDGHHRGGRLVE